MPFIEDLGGKRTGQGAHYVMQNIHEGASSSSVGVSGSSSGRKRTAAGGDSSSRARALSRRLADLDRENFQENIKIEIPRPNLVRDLKQGFTTNSRRVLGSRKTLTNHLDDDVKGYQTWLSAAASHSRYPARNICGICGYWGTLSCINCGERYCGSACATTHRDTRCLKSYS